jgi:hypothetical protein
MIPATFKKLREAKFFLVLLEEEQRVPILKAIEEHSEFYFNAFVSAGRNVTFALQAEEKAKYKAWFPSWESRRSEAERLTLKQFSAERVKIVHRTGSELSSRNVLTPDRDRVAPTSAESYAYYMMTRRPHPGSDAKVGTLQLICRFSDNTEVVAADAAHTYFAVLESLVTDFVRQYKQL